MKLLNIDGTEKSDVKLPNQFAEEVRPNMIKKAVLMIQTNARQPYGADPRAGKKGSHDVSRRRRKYRGSYGHGISRVPRKVHSSRGTQFNWTGAFAPQTRGGRRAHPPTAEKDWSVKINKKENRKAIRSAMAAVMDKEIVSERGHKIPDNYPFIIDSAFEALDRTKAVKDALLKLELKDELERVAVKKVRAGKGTLRGRKYQKKTGPLLVVGDDCKLMKAAANMPGIDVVKAQSLNAELLAPGCMPGRLTIFTENAITKVDKEKLFK